MLTPLLQKLTATLQDLRSLLSKLLYVAQCYPPARLFINRMLENLHACPYQGHTALSDDVRKDLA